jgi:tetratricopeptide (TPR) repeat protein
MSLSQDLLTLRGRITNAIEGKMFPVAYRLLLRAKKLTGKDPELLAQEVLLSYRLNRHHMLHALWMRVREYSMEGMFKSYLILFEWFLVVNDIYHAHMVIYRDFPKRYTPLTHHFIFRAISISYSAEHYVLVNQMLTDFSYVFQMRPPPFAFLYWINRMAFWNPFGFPNYQIRCYLGSFLPLISQQHAWKWQLLMGIHESRMGDKKQAVAHFNRASDLAPRSLQWAGFLGKYRELATTRLVHSQYIKKIKKKGQNLAQHGNQYGFDEIYVRLLCERENYEEAEEYLKKCTRNPQGGYHEFRLMEMRVSVYLRQKRVQPAIQYLEQELADEKMSHTRGTETAVLEAKLFALLEEKDQLEKWKETTHDFPLLCAYFHFSLNPTKKNFNLIRAEAILKQMPSPHRNGDVYVCHIRLYWVKMLLFTERQSPKERQSFGYLAHPFSQQLRLICGKCQVSNPNCGIFWTMFTKRGEENTVETWHNIMKCTQEDTTKYSKLYLKAHFRSSEMEVEEAREFQYGSIFGDFYTSPALTSKSLNLYDVFSCDIKKLQ